MFTTAFVWGLGCSLGAAIGLMALFVMFWSMDAVLGRTAKANNLNAESIEALQRRNELTKDTNDNLSAIADASLMMVNIMRDRK